MMKVKFELKSSGYCESKKNHALSGGAKKTIKFFATYAHIIHPIHGHILFDTGYTKRFYEGTQKLPFSIYAKVTKVYVEEKEETVTVLQQLGIAPDDIKYIIISHFHADHIGGLKDFPNAKFICSKAAWEDVRHRSGISALRRAFIPSLIPSDFHNRVQMVEISRSDIEVEHLGKVIDLFSDGSILLCQLEGHAKGQIGALIETENEQVFMVADAAWLRENYQDMRLPNPIVKLFFDSWDNFRDSLQRVHNFHLANPKTVIIPCHCEATFNEFNKAVSL